MSKATLENLIQVKTALAAKYESLAKSAGSVVKRRSFLHHAEKFRRQVARLSGG